MRLFNEHWKFLKTDFTIDYEEVIQKKNEFYDIGIPHDWLIHDCNHLYESSRGWYYKEFKIESPDRYSLIFDGIYMDCTIYLNDHPVYEWKYGYTSFEVVLQDYLVIGTNTIYICVDYKAPNSRWYTGAGIYRNVWLKKTAPTYLLTDGIYFHASLLEQDIWNIEIDTEVFLSKPSHYHLFYEINDTSCNILQKEQTLPAELIGKQVISFHTVLQNPTLWDIDNPHTYELNIRLHEGNTILDVQTYTIGFRDFRFDCNQGFFLNGKHIKLKGVCEHHDLGALGAAFHEQALERRFHILKDMGVNAIRISHNMPAREVMEYADKMGFLIVSEAFDMWMTPKTEYDYARFFKHWYKTDIASWIRRDRNHPSILLWSIGNEISDTNLSEEAIKMTQRLKEEVSGHDPKKNAEITIASNYMPWKQARKCTDIVSFAGYNYGEKYYDKHHREYPHWYIYGSEVASIVQSRGIYHFPLHESILTDEDLQCSSLGNSITSWGASSFEACIRAEINTPYSLGHFIWSGFDYIGEPTPYHTKNSYFGQIDTAGFPKDSYYMYKAQWTDYKKAPFVHIFPYWDFNPGQIIDVRICSNAPMVELFFNGKSQGVEELNLQSGEKLIADWRLPYEDGELLALAYDENGNIIARESKKSFGEPISIETNLSKTTMLATGEDLLFIEIYTRDSFGNIVENASNRIHIDIKGNGTLIGTDNGDSTDMDSYKSPHRKLFSGKLLAICKSGISEGNIDITLTSIGLQTKHLCVPVYKADIREGISLSAYEAPTDVINIYDNSIGIRNIKLYSENGLHLDLERPETIVYGEILPENASCKDLYWDITNDAGIRVDIAEWIAVENGVKVIAKSDGNFRLRCMSREDGIAKAISCLEFMISGFGIACKNPYTFISAGLYDYRMGDIGNGNEHGVATARDGESAVGFYDIDFGKSGSDMIRIPIFALTDEAYSFRIYEGIPYEGGECIGDFIYQKPKIWNVYQEVVWKLNKKLYGIRTISFLLNKKVHIKGFEFLEKNISDLGIGDIDFIYGDHFEKRENCIKNIGNNVTIEYKNLNFGESGVQQIEITGETPLDKNLIDLRFIKDNLEDRQSIEFSGGHRIQAFDIGHKHGIYTLRLIFLPGAKFDLYHIRFL